MNSCRVSSEQQPGDSSLNGSQPRVLFEQRSHRSSVKPSIALSPRCPHCRALAAVQHPELKHCEIGGASHDPAQGIDLPNDCPLRYSTNGGIARHLADCLERACNQAYFGSSTC